MSLKMRHIEKSFGQNHVLKGVDLTLHPGEVLALLGENGAGKSTLMNILGAVLPMDQGTIHLDDQAVHWQRPSDSLAAGVSFIHQELSLIVDLPIYENMFLGAFPKLSFGRIDHARMIRETREVFDELGINLDPKLMVRDLDQSYKQIVEIARAFHQEAKYIIMDEPTASLTETEIDRVFAMIDRLRQENVGMIFISHKLNEVMRICDRYMVLRNGSVVADGQVKEATIASISSAMVGHELVEIANRKRPTFDGDPVLVLENMTDIEGVYHDISLTLHPGEILGVTGLLGDGRSELFQTVFGARPLGSGTIKLDGKPVHFKEPKDAIQQGIGYVPRDRKENGILKDLSILDNSGISTYDSHGSFGVIDWTDVRKDFGEAREQLDMRLQSPDDLITSLSGGNQQKVVLSRWLTARSHVLVLDNPTQGVDVGAKEDIYEIIFQLASEGMSIVVLSSEAAEIIRLCDRAVVLFGGRIQGELTHDEMTEQKIMHLATGAAIAEHEQRLKNEENTDEQ